MMFNFSVRLFAFGAICAALAAGTSAANAQILNPNAYTSDGVLSLTAGTYTLDTDALTFAGNSGVLSNGIAVFDFSSINVGANATVYVVGSHPLALLSRSDATFGAGSAFNLNGGYAPGSPGGTIPFLPPGVGGVAGAGGYAGGMGSSKGTGPGASDGGGSFGGNGVILSSYGGLFGHGSFLGYGPTYGNLLSKLEGGSGGGGSGSYSGAGMYFSGGGGGGGGGAIEINAIGNVTLAGSVNANGGGGTLSPSSVSDGGAGGGVLLAGNRVNVTNTGAINATGGSGYVSGVTSPGREGGGGGGGRITIQTGEPNGFAQNGALEVNGGYTGNGLPNGGDGVISVITAVPESGAGSLLMAILGAVPVVAALRRRRK